MDKPTDNSFNPFLREDDFRSLYANNIQFEVSAWDLKLTFGQLDQSNVNAQVKQTVAISIPWVQTKILLYLLELQVHAYEQDFCHISTPPSVKPVVPLDDPSQTELTRAILGYMAVRHRLLFSDPLPSIAPVERDLAKEQKPDE